MIKFLPEIYPDEAAYSFLARCYAYSRYIWNRGFLRETLERPTANIDCTFLNIFTSEFKKLIDSKIGFERFVLDHTLFKYYARFLPLTKRKSVFKMAVDNKTFLTQHLPIPLNTNNDCLRYCPECVKEDRLKYGEAYIHIAHTIPEISICSKHACKLTRVEFITNKINNTALIPLEHSITDMETRVCDKQNIELRVAQYITEVFNEPLNLKDELIIGNFLSNKLSEQYISPRGEQRYVGIMLEDIKVFYKGLISFDITKNRLSYIYRNLTLNPYDILLVSMFQNIPPHTLCSCKCSSKPKHIIFDNKVREMHRNGLTMHKISQMLNVNHEVIRQILIGTYDKPKHACSTYKSKKWDWESIDNECCKAFYSKVATLDKKSVSRNTVAELFGLKDKRLRNLPKLNTLINEYKANSI